MPVKSDPAKAAISAARHERPTLAAQLARQHELLMAAATKPARTAPQTVELAERSTGARDGQLRIASLALVQHDGESDVQFLGRLEDLGRKAIAVRDTLNAEQDARAVGAEPKGEE